jgi:hypothetical protein
MLITVFNTSVVGQKVDFQGTFYCDTRIHPETRELIYQPIFNLSTLTSTFRYDTFVVENGLKLGLYLLIGLEMFLCCYCYNCTARAVHIPSL